MPHRYPESCVFHRALGRELPAIARGHGAELWDTEGRRYLDGSGGAVVVNVGHGRQEVAAAMARQAAAAAYVHGTQFTSDVARGVRAPPGRPRARRLHAALPRLRRLRGQRDRGEAGARLPSRARASRRRHKVIRRSVSYHGNTLATLSLSGRPTLQAPYQPLLAGVPQAPAPFCYHCPLEQTYPDCGVACVDDSRP